MIRKIRESIVDDNITPREKAYSLKKYVIYELIKNPAMSALNVFLIDRKFLFE